ncbi:contractile injection system protein, VgrG/Pvc8 family, partial [Pseudomonas sp. WHRI 8822A]
MAITQQSRMAKVSSPLGDNALVMERLAGSESLGRLFHYELSLASENASLKLNALLGKPMGLAVQLADGSDRYFHGIVARCSQTAHRGQFASY